MSAVNRSKRAHFLVGDVKFAISKKDYIKRSLVLICRDALSYIDFLHEGLEEFFLMDIF